LAESVSIASMCQFKKPAPLQLWYPSGPGAPGSSAESARGISPRAADRSVLDSLPSHGSCHPGELPPSTETSGHLLCQLAHDDLGAELPPSLHGHYPASSRCY